MNSVAKDIRFTPVDQGFREAMGRETRDQRKSRRRRNVRARTVNMDRLAKREFESGKVLYHETDYWKPKIRADCERVERPCPYVSCRYNLFLEVTRNGSIKQTFGDLEPDGMAESCALDVADRGGATLEEVARCFNISQERARQLQKMFLARLRYDTLLHEHWDEPSVKFVRRRALSVVGDDDCDGCEVSSMSVDCDLADDITSLDALSTVDVGHYGYGSYGVSSPYGDRHMTWDDELSLAMKMRANGGVQCA